MLYQQFITLYCLVAFHCMDISEIIYPLPSPLSTAPDGHWSCSQFFTIIKMWIWTFMYKYFMDNVKALSLGKWSERLRSGMAGLFGLFNFFRKLNCALIHILISSELNIQFLYNSANIQAALWKAGMLFFLSICPKLCTFSQLRQAVMMVQQVTLHSSLFSVVSKPCWSCQCFEWGETVSPSGSPPQS